MITQRLLNKFPIWTRARTDPSSLTARLFSAWGEYFDYAHADLKRIAEDYKILKRGLGVGHSYHIVLEEENYMTSSTAINGQLTWSYPTVEGVIGITNIPLTAVSNIDDMFWSTPSRIVTGNVYGVDDFLIYSDDRQGNVVNNDIAYPAHLQVLVGDSTNFYRKTAVRNLRASGRHFITITGYDLNHIEVKEVLEIKDDGLFVTRNIFEEIIEVNPEGFDGPIEMYIGAPLFSTGDFIDPFRVCALDHYEGQLYLLPESELIDVDTYTRLTYFTKEIVEGTDYKDGSPEVVNEDLVAWEQYLVDSGGTNYTFVDIAIDPNSTKLVVLDDAGFIHLYDYQPTPFGPPQDTSVLTDVSFIDILPVKPYVRFDEELTFYTRYTRIREEIVGVTIYRIAPGNVQEYLQADKSWAGSVYEFPGTLLGLGSNADVTWIDFKFTSIHDDWGQWDYYCQTRTSTATTVNCVSTMVDKLVSVADFDTGVTGPLAVWFGPDDSVVVSSSANGIGGEANTFHTFQLCSDVFYPDPTNQILYFRESYDSIEVT
jgi:hypothetical protein